MGQETGLLPGAIIFENELEDAYYPNNVVKTEMALVAGAFTGSFSL